MTRYIVTIDQIRTYAFEIEAEDETAAETALDYFHDADEDELGDAELDNGVVRSIINRSTKQELLHESR